MNNKITMFEYLKENYGISKHFIANKIGIRPSTLQFFEENGFPPDILEKIELLVNEIGEDLKQIKFPKSMVKKEAA